MTGHDFDGNGRLDTLRQMKMSASGRKPPRNIRVDSDGMWLFPAVMIEVPVEQEAALALALNRTNELGGWNQKIGVQKWVALFLNGIQGWCEWRRLDFEKLEPCVDGPQFDVGDKPAPVRLTYPTNEQSQNNANYQSALSLLGGSGDRLTTKVWWDVK